MKKSTLIIIAGVYALSVLFISLFGLKSAVYSENIPVTSVACINESEDNIKVSKNDSSVVTEIKLPFTQSADSENLTGTILQLYYKVLPDNATKKDVQFIYSANSNFEFVKDDNGNELGLILFSGKVNFQVKIMSTDGTKKYCEFYIWVY